MPPLILKQLKSVVRVVFILINQSITHFEDDSRINLINYTISIHLLIFQWYKSTVKNTQLKLMSWYNLLSILKWFLTGYHVRREASLLLSLLLKVDLRS